MSKINGCINLQKDGEIIYSNFPIKGIKTNDKIVYKENDINVTIFVDNNTIEMKRRTGDYIIELIFLNGKVTNGNYHLIEYKNSINLNIETLSSSNQDNKIILDYNLSMAEEFIGHFTFSLEFEVK